MFVKRILILKPCNTSLQNIICYIEKNRNRCKLYLKNNCLSSCGQLFVITQYDDSKLIVEKIENFDGIYSCYLPDYFDCNKSLNVALGNIDNNQIEIMYKGATGTSKNFENKIIEENKYIMQEVHSLFAMQSEEKKEENNQIIEHKASQRKENKNCNDCENCVYKKAFYESSQSIKTPIFSQENDFSFHNVQTEESIKNNQYDNEKIIVLNDKEDKKERQNNDEKEQNSLAYDNNDFFSQISDSIQELFTNKPTDFLLQNSIDDSKFVKINYEDTEDYYSVGVIYEDTTPKYICYALPCQAGSPPPENMKEFSQYLPIDENKAYYLMYQDARTGENIIIQTI